MKIVATYHPTYPKFIGIISSLAVIEPQTTIWIPQHKPVFDMFDEVQPDLLICMSEDLTPQLVSALTEYKTDVIIFGLQYPQEITPRLLCCDNIPKKILDNIKTPTYNVLSAANTAQFKNGTYHTKYASDILYISNKNLDVDTDLPILQQLSTADFKIKMCGPQVIPLPQYIGQANPYHLSNLLASTKIVLDFDENIMWDAAFNKVFCLSNKTITDKPHHTKPMLYPSFVSASGFLDEITHFLSDEKHRQSYIKRVHYQALHNTYFHCLKEIGVKVNVKTWVDKANEKIKEIT